jgi:asparagine synthase (glutamine-hydrolysing)
MSAIFGVYHPASASALPMYLEKMDGALAEHGPDGNGLRVDGPMGIGQRLMCFTLEDHLEHQPLVDGNLTLVADARIDNRPELADIFGLLPHEAVQLPDSAFILLAFQKWGHDCGLHLVGEFAFAIWDSTRQQLFASRSPLGGRMLFYHHSGSVFVFATVPRGLLALPFIPRVLDEEKVAGNLVGAARDPQATFFKGITRMLPGHCLTFDKHGLNMRPYWQPDLKREIRFKNDDDYVEAFLELYDRVTSDFLRSTTPVGVFMSGGLDSASLAATAALVQKRRGERITSFTEVPRLGFEGVTHKGYYTDETPFIQAIANMHSNLDAHFVRTTGRGLLDGVETLFDHASMPFRNVSNRVWWEAILMQAKEQGIRVLLTGEQGNLTISWTGSGLIEELVRGGKWKQVLSEARASVRTGQARSVGRVLIGQAILPFLPPHLINTVDRRRNGKQKGTVDLGFSPIRPEFAKAHRVAESFAESERRADYYDRTSMRESRYQTLVAPDLASTITVAYRAMYGVDTRVPLSDLRLVEFCLSLPEAQQNHDGQTRWLIRRAMTSRLPQQIVENQQRGFQAADWLERLVDSHAAISDDLSLMERSELATQILDVPRLQRLMEECLRDEGGPLERLRSYRTLESGLMMGRFLRWFEAG